MQDIEQQIHIIQSGGASVVPMEDLKEKLKTGRPLRIKLGVDPTAPDLHLGHAVPLRKLRQFQDMGHIVVLIIGGGTAQIGDPSGRSEIRPMLSKDQIDDNAKTYMEQAFKILDPDKTELRNNADWINALDLPKLAGLMSNFTVARILERDDFEQRLQKDLPLSLSELLYPVMQAYDSVEVNADIEIGGTDQLFNLLAGRELMKKLGMEPQVTLTLPLLEGTDGVKKMSKSYGNYIGITDAPADMFGKVMSIPDDLMERYLYLASSFTVDESEHMLADYKADKLPPNELKRKLAANIVTSYYDASTATDAEAAFDRTFKDHEAPEDTPEVALDVQPGDDGLIYMPAALQQLGFAKSSGEGRRLIDGGGI
ncbi:MAG: tyrosine--tRNA ligase, partial [Coriobacteriales bacterium]|nr:tyrosine--tRNA ligase [Coriobacteriales bacterium]